MRKNIGVEGDQPGEIENGKVRLYVIGQGALGAAAGEATKHDIAQAEKWNLPIVMIVLLAVFGSLAAAAMPLLLGVCTVAVTMGVVFLLSMVTTMSVFVTSTVSMFGIAAGGRLLAVHPDAIPRGTARRPRPDQAADAAMATSGLAVVLSGSDRHRLDDRHLPHQHPGAPVDGHRRDPRGGDGGADLDHADPRGAGNVRQGRRQDGRRYLHCPAAPTPRSPGSGPDGSAG